MCNPKELISDVNNIPLIHVTSISQEYKFDKGNKKHTGLVLIGMVFLQAASSQITHPSACNQVPGTKIPQTYDTTLLHSLLEKTKGVCKLACSSV